MKTIDALVDKLKEAKDELTKNVNMSYSDGSLAMSEEEPHKDDPHHEAKEKDKAKKIKEKAEELLDMHKAEKAHSVFTMEHAHSVLAMPHDKAKEHLHSVVDASSATPANKSKIKSAITGSKSTKDLSHMVSNHVLAAGGKGIGKVGELKVIKSDDHKIEMEKMCLHKNGQWSIEKCGDMMKPKK